MFFANIFVQFWVHLKHECVLYTGVYGICWGYLLFSKREEDLLFMALCRVSRHDWRL